MNIDGNTIGTLTVTVNTPCNEDGFFGIQVRSTGTVTVTDNIIGGVLINGTTNNASSAGIHTQGAAAGTAIIENNTIGSSEIKITSQSILNGIWLTATASTPTNYVERNFIKNLTNTATGGTRQINGIKLDGTTFLTGNVWNNVALLTNTADVPIYGIHDNNSNTLNIYHNTISIGGTGTASPTAALYRAADGLENVKNNVFYNERSNESGINYAIYQSVTTGTYSATHNYLDAVDPAKLCYNGSDRDITYWKASVETANTITGTVTLDVVGGTGDPSDCDGAGTNLLGTVNDDKDGPVLGNPRNNPPWIGAYEGPTSVLPIELLFFKAVCEGEEIKLHWSTATEINNDYFTLERAFVNNGKIERWDVIGIVKGSGTSNNVLNYHFTDPQENSPSGDLYYRLKQTDFDGQYKYSDIVAGGGCSSNNSPEISIFPNPGMEGQPFYLLIKGMEHKNLTVSIMDLMGQEVYKEPVTSSLLEINLQQKLASGLYFLSVHGETTSPIALTKKILIR